MPDKQNLPAFFDYEANPIWRSKPFTPTQIVVHDIRLEAWRQDRGPLLEINERSASSLVPDTAAAIPSTAHVRAAAAANNPIERQRFIGLENDYGWIRHLRLLRHQKTAQDPEDSAKCRWIHCSSKFPEYLRGFLWALSDDTTAMSDSQQVLDEAIQRKTRFSKHGKYFVPFSQPLRTSSNPDIDSVYPLLMAVPFLDWTVLGETPPLRFQIDRREGFRSAETSSHLLRSVLQYFYRLEDTSDREASQVFAKHKPWSTNRELDLKVRRWYGHYPNALNCDELWILVIDSEHIVTMSSNQTWKSLWPPLQLKSRISDVSFRDIRNAYFRSHHNREYNAISHAICCLSGAVGMVHRNFWADIVLPAADRYAGHLSHLQYRLHRSPSTKLVMDLIACQEELNIVIQITQQQIDMISDFQALINNVDPPKHENEPLRDSRDPMSTSDAEYVEIKALSATRRRATYRSLGASEFNDPMAQLLDNLHRELVDLRDLRDNTDRLVTRTIQLVNIRLEDHGKAILVFTVVTIVFLPLNFVSSFFGMNFRDIRDMAQTQWLFWAVALCVTTGVVASSLFLAFSGSKILERVFMWKDQHKEARQRLNTTSALRQRQTVPSSSGGTEPSFKVLNAIRTTGSARFGDSFT